MRTRKKRAKSPATTDTSVEPIKKPKKKQTYVQVKQRLGLYKRRLRKGDTKLHILMRHEITVAEFKAYLEHIGEDKAILLAKTPNNNGKLPIKEIPTNRKGVGVRRAKTIEQCMLRLTRTDTLLPMGQLLNHRELMQQYPVSQSTIILRANLRVACDVVNRVRALGLRSATMPCFDSLTEREKNQISTQISQIRARSDTYVSLPMKGSAKPSGFMHYSRLHIGNHLFSSKKVGNCLEYAKHALEYLRDEDSSLRIEAMCIANGDHVFVVLGRARGSDVSDFTTWGEAAVVCDAWAGSVYPASKIPECLGDYRNMSFEQDGEMFNVITAFNPDFHRIKSEYELPAVKR